MEEMLGIGGIIKSVLKPLGIEISRVSEPEKFNPSYDLAPEQFDGLDRDTRRVLNLINYTKKSHSTYSAQPYDSAYHSIELDGFTFSGQRNPRERLESVLFDFADATVLDIGCNQGGMIFELSDRIRHGVGIDYDTRMINAANRLRSYRKSDNIDFFVFNLENEDLNLIENFLQDRKVDIVFLLSVCMWIENWRDVIDKALQLSENLLFESNGNSIQQKEQEDYLRKIYSTVTKVRDSSPDDSNQKYRKLFLCKK